MQVTHGTNCRQSKNPFWQACRQRHVHHHQNVLELVNEGLTFEQIIQDYYPDLKKDDIHACLQYAIALVAA